MYKICFWCVWCFVCLYTRTDDCLHSCTFLLRCIVLDNLWFLMLPSKVAATMPVPVSQWMGQCDANWAGRRTAACYLLADTHCSLDWMVRVEEVKCLVGMSPRPCRCVAVWQKWYLYWRRWKLRFHAALPIGGCMDYINVVCSKAETLKFFLFT